MPKLNFFDFDTRQCPQAKFVYQYFIQEEPDSGGDTECLILENSQNGRRFQALRNFTQRRTWWCTIRDKDGCILNKTTRAALEQVRALAERWTTAENLHGEPSTETEPQ